MRFKAFAAALGCVLTLSSLSAFPVSAQGYGQGKQVNENNVPIGAVEFNNAYKELNALALSEDERYIILTFDQGYENGYTTKILDTLKEKNVKAIFFLTGDYAKRERALVERMVAEGHVLGNHGMTHAAMPTLSADELETEIVSLHDYVEAEYGYTMQYLRPPCGEFTDSTLAAAQKLGYSTVFWSFAYVDWLTDSQPDEAQALSELTDSLHGGAIYLLHSVSATNAAVLGDFIDAARAKGYQL
ncbi:MAG: polysaccharide deacetylase [Ruminococcus sp.]|nr:polysaccharide deacetylase [Ruminococcus sp.]MBQ8905700.1 polysaccharide deacetylase family protein [Ruminococcus sp.]